MCVGLFPNILKAAVGAKGGLINKCRGRCGEDTRVVYLPTKIYSAKDFPNYNVKCLLT